MSSGDAAYLAFRARVAERLGLWFEDHRRDFLEGVLRARVAVVGGNRESYLDALAQPESREEWRRLASLLTVTETYFLRGSDHFRALAATVLADCIRRAPPHRPLRLLSAGCASGEEAYSLAIVVAENRALLSGRPVEIVGIDVNREMLAKARSARYSEWSLRETPPEIRQKYFRRQQADHDLDPRIVGMVTFQERNLSEPNPDLWQPGRYDVLFCRNMLMYLVPQAAAAIVRRIEQSLVPGGYLFLGHAETLRGLSHAFHLRRDEGAFYYQLRHEAEVPVDPSPPRASAPATAPPPAVPAAGEPTWFEEINRSTARIAGLVPAETGPVPAEAQVAAGSFLRVLDLHRQERFTEALALVEREPAGARPDSDYQVLQAVLLLNCGRVREAENLGATLLAADELNSSGHFVMGLCREQASDIAAAEEHYATAAYLDPSFAMPRFHHGRLCQRLGRSTEALGHFEAALVLLLREDPVRLVLFGGGFSREALAEACRHEIARNRLSP